MNHPSNTDEQRPTFVTHLECSSTGQAYEADRLHGLSQVGKPLLVRYDLEALGASLERDDLEARPRDMWRYRELLPVRHADNIVSLGEVMTPLLPLDHTAAALGTEPVLVKDESRLPTGSFKARGLSVAVSMAKELGLSKLAMPTNGNAGAALAAYGSKAGIETFVFCPDDTPDLNVREIAMAGARVWRVNGLINECGRLVSEGTSAMGWFDVATLKEPYRLEGKKTMGLELVEQLGWSLPDVIFYPTGGGTGLIGMWKAFSELIALGWAKGPLPRMIAVQSTGCAPIVRAFHEGANHASPWSDAATVASGIRVPAAIGDFLILDAIRQSGGSAMAVSDEDIIEAQERIASTEGILMSPEGAATVAAYREALNDGSVRTDDRVVLFNSGNGLKYPMPAVGQEIDLTQPVDYGALNH